LSDPLASIVVPTLNGAATLPALLDAVRRQRAPFRHEVIAVDSGSTDGTAALLRDRVDRLIEIAPGEFNHGVTRNIGIEQARGDLVVLLVQDAVPASEDWLATLTAPLLADARVAGTFGRQLPRADASALTRYFHTRWFAASDVARTTAIESQAAFDAMTPAQRFDRCIFDNVCSCIRRTVWTMHPFRRTTIAEDLEWAKEVLLSGYRIEYVPASAVVHSHERSAAYEFARTRLLHERLRALFGLRTIPTLPLCLRAMTSSLLLHLRCERSVRAMQLAVAWPLGQYLGGRR